MSDVQALLQPDIKPALSEADITSQPAQLLVISHPDFVAGLDPLVQARIAEGYTVEVVDVDQVYSQFAFSLFDPQAIKDYIATATAPVAQIRRWTPWACMPARIALAAGAITCAGPPRTAPRLLSTASAPAMAAETWARSVISP